MIYTKILKIVGAVAAAFLLLITIVIYFVLTPERITPIVNDLAADNLDAEVQIGGVEATFFSSFPHLGIKIDSALIVSNAFQRNAIDTIRHRRDTVAVINKLRASFGLMDYLTQGKISFSRIYVADSKVRLITDKDGRYNWDIVRQDTTATANEDTTEQLDISLQRIRLKNVDFTYANRIKKTVYRAKNINARVSGDLTLGALDAEVEYEAKNMTVIVDETKYLSRLDIAAAGEVKYNGTDKYELHDTHIFLADHEFDLNGYLQSTDSATNYIDMNFALKSKSADSLFGLLPASIISVPVEIESGSVSVDGSVIGNISKSETPVVRCNALINDIKAEYENMPEGIEKLNAEFHTYIDYAKPDSSYANLDIFQFKGGKTEVESVVKIKQLLADAIVFCKVKAHVDLHSILDVFPLENTEMYGIVDADLIGDFRLADIRDYDFGRIRIGGKLVSDSLYVGMQTDSTIFTIDSRNTDLKFYGNDTLYIKGVVDQLRLKTQTVRVGVNGFNAWGKSLIEVDTTELAPLSGGFTAKNAFVRLDTIILFGKHIDSHAYLGHTVGHPRYPHAEAVFDADTIFSGIYGVVGFSRGLKSTAMLEQVGDSAWNANADVVLARAYAKAPQFSLPITSDSLRIQHHDKQWILSADEVRTGSSSMRFNAKFKELILSLMNKQPIKAELTMEADTVNCNELMNAIVETAEMPTTAQETDTSFVLTAREDTVVISDTLGISRLPRVPKFLELELNTKVNHLIWNKLVFDNFGGALDTKDGRLRVKGVNFEQAGSKAIMLMSYKTREKADRADVDMFVRWERADIGSLISSMGFDTIMPVLAPLQGKVDCYLTAEAEIDSGFNVDMDRLKVAAHLGAKELTFLDSETFARLSKILMFKNKEVNRIDTVSSNILIDSGKIEILPFAIEMDRYRGAIGGGQDLDGNLNYHISILKSPLPFKAGVNITGPMDDIDFDVTTAKLKKKVGEDAAYNNDSISLARRKEVIGKILGIDVDAALKARQDSISATNK